MRAAFFPMIVVLAASAARTTASAAAAAPRVVDRYSASWAQPPTVDIPHLLHLNSPAFPSGPFVGNGDVSFIYVGNGTNAAGHAVPRTVLLVFGSSLHSSCY
jgi:hypothetical protein